MLRNLGSEEQLGFFSGDGLGSHNNICRIHQWDVSIKHVSPFLFHPFCLAWQDNNIVLALSNIYTTHNTDNFQEKVRKRPTATSTNVHIIRTVFGKESTKELYILRFIDDYNYYIGGVNLANQFREAYKVYRTSQRNW